MKKWEKINKDLADIANKVWQNPNAFEKFKTKMKTCKKPQKCSDLFMKNAIKRFGKNK